MSRRQTLLLLIAIGALMGGWIFWRNLPPVSDPAGDPEPKVTAFDLTEDAIFSDVTSEMSLDFVHEAGNLEDYYFPAIMAGGCALFDFDNDGLLDVYLVNGNREAGTTNAPSAAKTRNQLFRQTEKRRFENVTESSGLGDDGYGMGVAVGDVNNDGADDVYLTNAGADKLYLNLGGGVFRDVTETAGIENLHWSASATFVDFDRDGWLDLYVTNYVDYFPGRRCTDATGRGDFCGPQSFFPVPDKLFRNVTGDRQELADPDDRIVRFEDVSVSSKIAGRPGAGLGVVCVDVNDDRWPDIYVANDRMANALWINQQDGTFQDEAVLRGVAFDSQGRPQASMGIAVADFNGDARPDFYVTHFQGESNALYLSEPGHVYSERSAEAGLLTPTFPLTGFGTAAFDVNHDCFADILVVNGRVKRNRPTPPGTDPSWSEYAESNQIFFSKGQSGKFATIRDKSFSRVADVWRGLATGDIDQDGDLDLLATAIGGEAKLYRNAADKAGGWLQVLAVDPRHGGRPALGAVVTVAAGDLHQTAFLQSGTSYLSASQPVLHFGMGSADAYDWAKVIWPDGEVEYFSGGSVSARRTLKRGMGQAKNEFRQE